MRIFRWPFESWIPRVLFFLFICFWAGGHWQRPCGAQTLSSKAKESFELGKIAAKQGAWDLALEHFEKAHKQAPKVPGVLYALGTTHEQVGHPVVAAVFLRAYLEAWPDAPNADTVQSKILGLEVFIDRLVKDLFKEAWAAAEAIPKDQDKKKAQHEVIKTMAEAGELRLVRDFGFNQPLGVPWILQERAVQLTDLYRQGPLGMRDPSPIALFDLAEELVGAEADYASAVPKYWYNWARPLGQRRSRICTKPAGTELERGRMSHLEYKEALKGYQECITEREEEKRRWDDERPKRRILFQGELLTGLAGCLYKAGLRRRALDTLERSAQLFYGSGLFDFLSCPPVGSDCLYSGHDTERELYDTKRSLFIMKGMIGYDDPCPGLVYAGCWICMRKNRGLAFSYTSSSQVGSISKDGRAKLRSVQDNFPKLERGPICRDWLEIVRTGTMTAYSIPLDHPALVRLPSLIERITNRPVEDIPQELARVALTLSRALNTLESARL